MKRFLFADVKTLGPGGGAGSGEFEAVLSVPTVDRDGEIVDKGAFDPLPESIPVHWQHDWAVPVGRGVPYQDGAALKIKGYFASTPKAQEVRTLVAEGVVGHMSVGFLFPERSKGADGAPHVTKGELFEASFTAVSANREAAVLAVKTLEREAKATKADRLQQIHDLAVTNGAACAGKAGHPAACDAKQPASGVWQAQLTADQALLLLVGLYP